MAFVVKNKKGKKVVLYNPAEKSQKYARELKKGYKTETGIVLTEREKGKRQVYLLARSDNAKAFKYNQEKKKNVNEFLKKASDHDKKIANTMCDDIRLKKGLTFEETAVTYKNMIVDMQKDKKYRDKVYEEFEKKYVYY